jgi:hypothetical protein
MTRRPAPAFTGSKEDVEMNKTVLVVWSFLTMILSGGILFLVAQERTEGSAASFYEKSLHFTNRGLEHWYSKENGGLERITGIPFSKLSCNGCHVRTCDTCHQKEVGGKSIYSLERAKGETACEKCHEVESRNFARKNPGDKMADVHFAKGMKCMDCHSACEIHGDGTSYDSMQAPGAMDTRCEKCHTHLSKCPSNAVHKGKLDCSACHVRDVPSCYNCHFDTKVNERKSVSIPLKNMLFLINRGGRVTMANLHTFVYQNRTMIVFAPAFSHLITREGRKCGDCHATPVLKDMKTGAFKPVVWEKGALKSAAGIIPVLDGFKWDFVFLNYVNGQWVPIEKPAEPLLNYSGYSTPITKEQLAKLAQPQSAKP